MRITKTTAVAKTTGRRSVKKAFAKQDVEAQAVDALSQERIQDIIRLKAYELYAARGYSLGNDLEDWLNAERIVLSRPSSD